MKKKLLALLLTAAMAMQPLSVAGAAEFTDGSAETVEDGVDVFLDGVDEAPMVEDIEVPEALLDREPQESDIQIGDTVWVTFDEVAQTAEIWGVGPTWDFLNDGTSKPSYEIKNPFIGNSFSKVTIMEGVTRIGNCLFSSGDRSGDYNPSSISDIGELEIANTVESIGKYAFACVQELSEIDIPGSVIEIGEWAFESIQGLKQVSLNEGLKKIGSGAFSDTSISSFVLPDSVDTIGDSVFAECKQLSNVQGFERFSIIPQNLFTGCPISEFSFENVTEIGAAAFEGTALSTVAFSDKLTSIGRYAFERCEKLTEIVLPNSNLQLDYTFAECVNLESVTIPENIKILRNTFIRCEKLTSATNKGNRTMLYNAFTACPRLVIHGYDCSDAKKYADENEVEFNSLGEGTHDWDGGRITKVPTETPVYKFLNKKIQTHLFVV